MRQFHCYSSFFFAEDRFGELFSELFRPAPALEQRLSETSRMLGGDYISISARFLELLGDFDEPRRERIPLHSGERDRLMADCINKNQRSTEHARKPGHESSGHIRQSPVPFSCFLGEPGILTIPGKIAHIDRKESDCESQMKTFEDFFAIAHTCEPILPACGTRHVPQQFRNAPPRPAAIHFPK